MFETQRFEIGLTALLVYDYFLTLNDEVGGFHNDSDTEKNSTTSHRSFMHGSQRIFSVRKPLCSLRSALANDILVFVIFLCASAHHYRYHASLTTAQTRYLPMAFQAWVIVCEWEWVSRATRYMQTLLVVEYSFTRSGIHTRGMLGSHSLTISQMLTTMYRRTFRTPPPGGLWAYVADSGIIVAPKPFSLQPFTTTSSFLFPRLS